MPFEPGDLVRSVKDKTRTLLLVEAGPLPGTGTSVKYRCATQLGEISVQYERDLEPVWLDKDGQERPLPRRLANVEREDASTDSLSATAANSQDVAVSAEDSTEVTEANRRKHLTIWGGLLLIALAITSGMYWSHEIGSNVIFGIGATGTGLVGYAVLGAVYSCPTCGFWYVRQLLRRTLVDEQGFWKTITRKTRDARGQVISSHPEQVHFIRRKWLNHFMCRRCAHQWATTSYREAEG